MTDSKVADLTAASSLTGAELIYMVQGGTDVKATPAELATLFGGPSGLSTPLQSAIFSKGMIVVAPGVGSNLTYIGTVSLATAVTGTLSHQALGGSSLREQARRGTITSSSVADSAASFRHSLRCCWRGDGAGLGGFFFVVRFSLPSTTSQKQSAVGLFSTEVAIPATQVPSEMTNCIFIGNDSADTNMQIMFNDGSGSCTKIDLGSSFPANAPTAVYEFTLFASSNDISRVSYRVNNLTSNAKVAGDITSGLPDASTFLTFHLTVNNGGTAQSVVLELMRVYLETNY